MILILVGSLLTAAAVEPGVEVALFALLEPQPVSKAEVITKEHVMAVHLINKSFLLI
jgi:hypothetical protein